MKLFRAFIATVAVAMLSATTVDAQVVRRADRDAQAREAAGDNNLSVRDVENLSKENEVKKKNPINRVSKEKEYDYVERKLKEVFGTKVRVASKKIEINFNNNNDLDRILEIMNIKFD